MSCLVQKDSQKLKPNRTMVKVSCFVCGYWHRTSPHWIREAGVGNCQSCGAQMYPARFDDCRDLCPSLVEGHPDHDDERERENRGMKGALREYEREHNPRCGHCDSTMPIGHDPTYWVCRNCDGRLTLNSRHLDGDPCSERVSPFSAEVEEANARIVKPAKTTRAKARRTVAVNRDAIPF